MAAKSVCVSLESGKPICFKGGCCTPQARLADSTCLVAQFRWRPSKPKRCLRSQKRLNLSIKLKLFVRQAEEGQVFRLSSRLK